MSREIKFRAWFELENKMVPHEDLTMTYDNDEGFTFAFDQSTRTDDDEAKGTLNFIPLQYTGLKDKNGVEIYEGDVLDVEEHMSTTVYQNGCSTGGASWTNKFKSVVEFSPSGLQRASYDGRRGVVIGNIYENPELLGKAGEA